MSFSQQERNRGKTTAPPPTIPPSTIRPTQTRMAEMDDIAILDPDSSSSSSCRNDSDYDDDYISKKSNVSLRITCYGSRSKKTPEKFLSAAKLVGYILAKRGHTCVNGGGATGCMGAMNYGAMKGNGNIIGILHNKFVPEGKDGFEDIDGPSPFAKTPTKSQQQSDKDDKDSNSNSTTVPIRQIIRAGGDDLQERKRLLVEGADALLVLPGGPGTWDELWEMACIRQLGLCHQRIVCVNVEGYYDPFQKMLQRADKDGLLHMPPKDIVHFECTPKAAIQWIEKEKAIELQQQHAAQQQKKKNVSQHVEVDHTVKKRAVTLREASYLHDPPTNEEDGDDDNDNHRHDHHTEGMGKSISTTTHSSSWSSSIGDVIYIAMALGTGVIIGMSLRRPKI